MAIEFYKIPSGIRKPGKYFEINSRNAIQGLAANEISVCIIGQKTSSGSIAENTPTTVTDAGQAALYFGSGSVCHRMADAAFNANPYIDLDICAVDDNGSTQASGSVAFTGTATAAGSVDVWIGDQRISVGVSSGDTAATVGTAWYTAATQYTESLPVTMSDDAGGTITLTAKNAGTVGNYIPITKYQTTATGITTTVTAMSAGATDPDLDSDGTLDAIFPKHYDIIIVGLFDDDNLGYVSTHLQSVAGPLEQRGGIGVVGYSSIVGNAATVKTLAGTTLNEEYMTLCYIDYANSDDTPNTPPYELAAAYGAVIASETDPARPLNNIVLTGVSAPHIEDRFSRTEQEEFLDNGVTPLHVVPGEDVAIVRAISTYTTNSSSNPDPTWLDITTARTLFYLRQQLKLRLESRFPRAKLSARTPARVRTQILDVLRLTEELEITENLETWKDGVVVERNISDPNRLDCKIPADVVNGLHIIAGRIDLIL